MRGVLFIIVALFIIAVSTLQSPEVSAACSGTDTFTLQIRNPGGTIIRSSSSAINPVAGSDCNTADSDSLTLSATCQAAGQYNASVDCSGCSAHSGIANTTILTCYAAESKKVLFRNASGTVMAGFDSKGYLYLRGFNFSNQASLSPPRNSYIVRNNTGVTVAYIDWEGNVYTRGRITANQSSILPPRNSVIVRNQTTRDVAYIDSTGNILLSGKMYVNWTDSI